MGDLNGNVFDYIVVGAGTAGCVMAARLSENGQNRVALVEAGGPDSHPFIHVPALVGAAIAQKHLNWRFMTVPQPRLLGRSIPVPRGRVVGGSGSINGMVYFRGQPQDFEDWAAAGNPGWSYREVLPYFLRSENNDRYPGSPFHAQGGPMNVMFVKRPNPMTAAFLAAMGSLGYKRNDDFNSPDTDGYGPRQGTLLNGRRVSTATAYLRPALQRSNLRLITDRRVARVVIENRRATGVELLVPGGGTQLLTARHEVVVSGGTIMSPQVLMLSGVGDGEHLRSHGIEVKHHLPGVGRNLHDHLAVGLLMEMSNTESYGISWRTLPRGAVNLLEYALFRSGPLSSNVFETNAFVRTTDGLTQPDLQLVFQTARRNTNTFPLPLGHGFALSSVALYPKSRGRITLASADPHALPLIDPNLLGEPSDIGPLLRGLQLSRRLVATPPFARYQAKEVQPGPSVQTDDGLMDYIRRAAATVHHPVSSCRMGPDENAVVDAQLRVHGIEALRVVDASVFPKIIGGNTNAAVVMVAEKAADLMLGIPALQPFELPAARSA
jgi:choline dehydrogenase-like flavoprotein